MTIALGEACSDARSDPTPNIGPLDSARGWSLRSWRNGHSADTQDKARTARLQGEGNCCGGNQKRLLVQTHAAEASSCQRVAARAAERSGLCPECPRCVRFSMSVETSQLWQSLRSNTLTQDRKSV